MKKINIIFILIIPDLDTGFHPVALYRAAGIVEI